MESPSSKEKTVLILGDWVVDEYWFVVRHQSQISSHTGFVHFRIASQDDDYISALCGAGEVAQVLYQLRDNNNQYELIGLGNWRGTDTEDISHLVHAKTSPDCPAAKVSSSIIRTKCTSPPRISLRSLHPESPTIRVIRQYHQDGSELKQLSRIDWEPPQKAYDPIKWSELELPESGVGYIVVQDLAKGAVTDDLISEIYGKYPNAKWYVRSKKARPEWLNSIADRVDLLVIGPEVAELLNPWQSWLAKGRTTKKALDIVSNMPGKHVVLLSDRREVVARTNHAKNCITAKSHVAPTPITMLGWPSAVFANLIFRLMESDIAIDAQILSEALNWADINSGVPLPKISTVSGDQIRTPYVHLTDWDKEVEDWKQAKSGLGIITNPTSKITRLDVWRGTTHLPGYVIHVTKKQEIIDRIGRNMLKFARETSPKSSLSIMLQADPGAGKTFLAKTLAKTFGFRFLRYDLTQLVHRDEVLDLFDTVANMQAEDNGPILVFVDEINALLSGNHAYGAFLAPLEEGYYARRGKSFSLRPCVWIFAGTQLDDLSLDKGEKLSDFKSRMTMIEKIDYQSLRNAYSNKAKLDEEARLEQVYLGAIMLQNTIPDVSVVDYEVLKQFHIMDPAESPARAIRKRVTLLTNVQYGTITKVNCVNWEGAEWDDDPKGRQPVHLYY